MLIACGMASVEDVINTTSAASMAASAPVPMAAPTSAPASTGASLIPSPTNMTAPYLLRIFPSSFNLPSGSSFACTSSMPVAAATASAPDLESPVSITECRPSAFNFRIADTASDLIVSEITIYPANVPFTARNTSEP